MDSIEKSGFLSKNISLWIEKHRNENDEWFKLCEKINDFSHDIMYKIKIHNEYLPEIIAASLYVRAMSNFQGIIIMSERGMTNEAKVLMRSFLEFVFAIVAIDKDKEIVNQFVLEDIIQRKDYLKAYKRNKSIGIHNNEDILSNEKIDDLLKDFNAKIDINCVKRLSKRDLAKKAELVTIYDSAYKLLSGTIHVNARDLEQYLELNDDGEIKQILWGPDVTEIDFMLFTATESMLFVLTAISHIFSIDYDEAWQSVLNTYNKLGKKFTECKLSSSSTSKPTASSTPGIRS